MGYRGDRSTKTMGYRGSVFPSPIARALVYASFIVQVAPYSLSRSTPPSQPVPGFACIPVPIERLVAPGQKAVMHIYDTSSLQALRHAQAHANSTYGQVVFDEEAMKVRKFSVMPLGSRIKILSVRPSTHVDKFGGSSTSLIATVIGIGILEPTRVLEKMPFMTIDCDHHDRLLTALDQPITAANEEALTELRDAAMLCQSLDGVASFKGDLTRASEAEAVTGGRSSWSLTDCIDCVLQARQGEERAEGCELLLSALACTVHLPGSRRFEAMRLAQQGQNADCMRYVLESLQEEGQRRLAMKALASVSVLGDRDTDSGA